MLRSVVQGIKRIPDGDVLGAGGLDVNGGEFLFELEDDGAVDTTPWELKWCHRMTNSRDHTEVEDLLVAIGVASDTTVDKSRTERPRLNARTQSSPVVLEAVTTLDEKSEVIAAIKRKSSLRKSLSIRRQSWLNKSSSMSRSMSVKVTTQALAA